jgi:MFS transporter, PPP family, 3-phenylpropionic acid transporter
LWGSIGFIVSVVGLGALLDWLPTSTVLHVVTFMLGGVVLAAWLMPRPAQHRLEETGESVMAVLRVKEVQCFLLAGFMNAFAHAALYTFFSLYLAELGYDKTTIGLLWALGVVVEIGIFRWMPQLTARFSVRSLFFATFVACALRFLIIAWGAQSFMLLLFAQLLHALTFAVYHASAVTLTGQYFGERNRARGQGVYISLTFGFGGFVGALVSGLMWEPFGASLTYTVSALAGALGALAYLRYRT